MTENSSNSTQKTDIRALTRNAAKGNISSMFELMNIYEKGTGVDINLIKSVDYQKKISDILNSVTLDENETPEVQFKLNSLKLINFRKFKTISIDLNKKLTIFIGNNGAGKTTILDAISRVLSYINARMIAKNRNGRPLDDFDVNVDCNDNAEVILSISLGCETKYEGFLSRPSKGIETSKSSNLDSFTSLSNLYRTIDFRLRKSNNSQLNIPLCAFYSVERTMRLQNQSFDFEKLESIYLTSKFDALEKSALDGSTNIEEFLKWFIFIDNQKSGTEINKEKEELITSIKTLESLSVTSKTLSKELEALKKRLHNINDQKNYQHYSKLDRYKTFVKDAIISSVPSISDIFIDRSSGRVEVKIINNGTEINIFQASKGQLVYISLIADLARRLILLNPNLSNPLNGQGIVLIDEIELHLHPEWQRGIINNLTKTFQNIQFIITTHSAQVLTTSSKDNIRSLSENVYGDDIAAIPQAETYARTPSDVMLSVMHVDPTPDYPEKNTLQKYRKIIEQGDFRSDKAKEIYEFLVKKLGSDHAELISLEMIKRKRERFE